MSKWDRFGNNELNCSHTNTMSGFPENYSKGQANYSRTAIFCKDCGKILEQYAEPTYTSPKNVRSQGLERKKLTKCRW